MFERDCSPGLAGRPGDRGTPGRPGLSSKLGFSDCRRYSSASIRISISALRSLSRLRGVGITISTDSWVFVPSSCLLFDVASDEVSVIGRLPSAPTLVPRTTAVVQKIIIKVRFIILHTPPASYAYKCTARKNFACPYETDNS